ncbi:Wadjet anti-phage system protein JetD domain-containing protein [Paraburkholderia acidipaludis]|uniref:Wadjet anti-phage system protein JetD domain-containing protein n=1 Tax=Paraburkholderia acidipaludis TaxID=660537 RepID=UPI0004826A95|nr:Wadjet anti-phage system protein JetD domain-containing protein [Paraburkholderia acidipaludis]
MDWASDDRLRVAAIRLLLTGRIVRSRSNADFVAQLEDVGVVSTTPRRGELVLVPDRLTYYKTFLISRWPDYREIAAKIQSRGLPIDVATLRDLRRDHLAPPAGFPQLNRRTLAAYAGTHSKSRGAVPDVSAAITTDDTIRARVNEGLRLRGMDGMEYDLSALQRSLTEIAFPDRGLSESWTFCGTLPRLLLTVENVGSFVDIKKPDDCLIVHSPGWNLPNVRRIRARLPASVRWRHFGDLDPNGIKIGLVLTTDSDAGNDAKVWIPTSAAALLRSHALCLDREWNEDNIPEPMRNHPALSWLIEHSKWLEQEPIVVLPEFIDELGRL